MQIFTFVGLGDKILLKKVISRPSNDLNQGSCKCSRQRGWILWRLLWRGITSVRCVHSPPFQEGCVRDWVWVRGSNMASSLYKHSDGVCEHVLRSVWPTQPDSVFKSSSGEVRLVFTCICSLFLKLALVFCFKLTCPESTRSKKKCFQHWQRVQRLVFRWTKLYLQHSL